MYPSGAQSYSSFGSTDLSEDPYKLAMEQAWRDGRAAGRKEKSILCLKNVPNSLRQSYKKGFYNMI